MLRFRPSLTIPRRHTATLVALLLAAQLSLFAHAIGHDYFHDADQSQMVCGLCIAAQHLDHGLAPASIELPHPERALHGTTTTSVLDVALTRAPFQARAPPARLPG